MGRTPFVREQILDAAFDLIAREGYEAVSTRAIATAAKVGPASMYRCFASKEALGRELYRLAVEPLLAEATALWGVERSARARVRGLVGLLYAAYDAKPRALALVVFPPHEFQPRQLDVRNPVSLRARLLDLCAGNADRAACLWGAITGPLQDRYLHQRAGRMTPHVATIADLAEHILP